MNMKDANFEQARKSLESKQRDPKRKLKDKKIYLALHVLL